MNRRNWLWAALLAVPLAVVGVVYATQQARPYVCPLTGENLPCEDCCPLNAQPFICPITGEELPCQACCPLNGKAGDAAKEPKATPEGGYICPLTGEELGCPNCCPLNQKK